MTDNLPDAPPELRTGTKVRLELDKIKPYWRNPRRISDEAVNALAASIRNYEYQQPIVVDKDHVIVVGHTRYAAMRRLGVVAADVLVADLTAEQATEYRIVDNRTSELTQWNFDVLDQELGQLGDAVLSWFPEFTEDLSQPNQDVLTGSGAPIKDKLPEAEVEEPDANVEFVCPSCFHMWETEVTRAQIINGRIEPAGQEQS